MWAWGEPVGLLSGLRTCGQRARERAECEVRCANARADSAYGAPGQRA